MADRGRSLVETLVAITVLGIGAATAFGALHTLSVSTYTAHERLRSSVQLLAARGTASAACAPGALDGVTLTDLDPCPRTAPRLVRVEAGVGQSHRHLTMIVDGGP